MLYLLHHAIENAAERFPDQTAVRCAGQSLTYAQLLQRVNHLASCLTEQGIGRGDRVGIYMNKSLESVIAIYGIMKAGGAYVPLDPMAPIERLRFVIQDCGIRFLVSSVAKEESLQQLAASRSSLECVVGVPAHAGLPLRCISWEEVNALPAGPSSLHLTEMDLAYILYTSGSTGNPKGIMHTHRSGLSFPLWAAETYGLHNNDRVSNHAPFHFDLSTFDLFATALAGATVVLIPEGIVKFPASVAKLIEQEQLTVWYSVPFALIQLLQKGGLPARDLSSLRWILFAGEPFPTKHLRELMAQLSDARFSNIYGPTETNVCTYYHVPTLSPDSDEPIPIGRPCGNVDDLVVNSDDQPVAAGEVGELLIRGAVVMRGYWGRVELTERAFFRSHSVSHGESPYYRTGDLVQLLPDGNYKYLGRKDRQIKTRGYRVELDEVEVTLLSHSWVQEAAVYAVLDEHESHMIKAAVTAIEGMTLTSEILIQHLANRLPAYALPAEIRILNEFPRTSTGKIDRRTLQSQTVPVPA
jgi:amino acid adenylation domain-containing protein